MHPRSDVPFAVKLLPGFQVDGTWNVPTTLTFVHVDGTWNVPTTLTFVGSVFSLIEIPDPTQEYCESRCDS
jgi:hypothetical protein